MKRCFLLGWIRERRRRLIAERNLDMLCERLYLIQEQRDEAWHLLEHALDCNRRQHDLIQRMEHQRKEDRGKYLQHLWDQAKWELPDRF